MKLSLSCMCLLIGLGSVGTAAQTSVVFIGNSFTYGARSPVQFYRSQSITDLNNEGLGGMPALVKSFADQSGLDYDVYIETRGGSALDFHLANKRDILSARSWDASVMHGYSTLDQNKPRNPALLIETSQQMAELLRERNPALDVYLMATWSRADQTFQESGAWAGEAIDTMARDVRAAYDLAADAVGAAGVIPVGEAWNRAMAAGVADVNPYDGIDPDSVNLWTYDHYHASAYGLYLEALVVFGVLTGQDPRALGDDECSAYELGFSQPQTLALQQVAYEQLLFEGIIEESESSMQSAESRPCAALR